jgi:hypothetical protein
MGDSLAIIRMDGRLAIEGGRLLNILIVGTSPFPRTL